MPLRDVYGMAEANWAAMQCSAGNYHVPPWVHAVVLDDDGEIRSASRASGLLAFFDPFGGGDLFPGFFRTADRVTLVSGRETLSAAAGTRAPTSRKTPSSAWTFWGRQDAPPRCDRGLLAPQSRPSPVIPGRRSWDEACFAAGRECGLECEEGIPGAVTARWPRFTGADWTTVLEELDAARERAPRGPEFWDRLKAAMGPVAELGRRRRTPPIG